jgi:hypothetical protein
MDTKKKSDDKTQLDEAQADAIVDEKQKKSTSGLSWDEVAKEDRKGWNETTEMGEGD